jgi:hypothetical protein
MAEERRAKSKAMASSVRGQLDENENMKNRTAIKTATMAQNGVLSKDLAMAQSFARARLVHQNRQSTEQANNQSSREAEKNRWRQYLAEQQANQQLARADQIKRNIARKEAEDAEQRLKEAQVKQLKRRVMEEHEIPQYVAPKINKAIKDRPEPDIPQYVPPKAIKDRPEPEATPYPKKQKKLLAIQDGDPYDEVPQLKKSRVKTKKIIKSRDTEIIKGPTRQQFKQASFPKLAVSKQLEKHKITQLEKAGKLVNELLTEHVDKKQKIVRRNRKPIAIKAK